MGLRALFVSAVVVLAALGCSGKDEPASDAKTAEPPALHVCGPFTACHAGNVVGRWRLDHVCVEEAYLSIVTSCPGGMSSVEEIIGYDASGTLSIANDGDATLTLSERAYKHTSTPAECSADPAEAAATCDMQKKLGADCTLDQGDCDCSVLQAATPPVQTGTFHAGDATLLDMDYCINGAGLTLHREGGDYAFVPE